MTRQANDHIDDHANELRPSLVDSVPAKSVVALSLGTLPTPFRMLSAVGVTAVALNFAYRKRRL